MAELTPESGALRLDRMAIEEAGPSPERMAVAIHSQLELQTGPVPVYGIAKALDIHEIRSELLDNLEGSFDHDVGTRVWLDPGQRPIESATPALHGSS